MKKTNIKNKTAKVKVKIFGQEIEQFGITSDDYKVTSDKIADYINTQRGDEEVGIVAKEITDFLGIQAVGTLI